jgi:hypothetical protein
MGRFVTKTVFYNKIQLRVTVILLFVTYDTIKAYG